MGYENSGRRPAPNKLKLLRGVDRASRLNPDEPKPPDGEVRMPEALSARAAEVWQRLAPICVTMGTLTTADVQAFGTLCELQATLEMASAQKNAEAFAPFTVGDDYNGVPTVRVHSALKLERETAIAVRPYYALFGLEPSGRARLRVPKSEAPKSKWQELIG